MADNNITDEEAQEYIEMDKYCEEKDKIWEFPYRGESISIPLVSKDNREKFLLDIYRGRIELRKKTFQNRYRQTIKLVRLDIGGQPHRNPDGTEIGSPHIHLYKENYDDKWAYEIDKNIFKNLDDSYKTLEDFMGYCNICELPIIIMGLFDD